MKAAVQSAIGVALATVGVGLLYDWRASLLVAGVALFADRHLDGAAR